MSAKHRVVVGLCTCQRPVMLSRCLQSIRLQQIASNLDVQLVVVDNEMEPTNREGVLRFAESNPFPVHYVHQPRRGIAVARNTVLNKAAELDGEWIIFIDDDETAAPDWLNMLMSPDYLQCPVLLGQQQLVYPKPLPFWAGPHIPPDAVEGAPRRTGSTCNVRFSMELVRAGLRFNETFGLANGSDTDFFLRANQNGFQIRQTLRAVTFEEMHPERLTYSAQVYKAYCHAISLTKRLALRSGRSKAISRALILVPRDLVLGTGELLISPVYVLAGSRRFAQRAVSGGRRLARAIGSVSGLLGLQPEPYRHVVGR